MYEYSVTNGFLDVNIPTDSIATIASTLRRHIIRWVAEDDAESMDKIFRCSRMCWELYKSGRLTDLDAEDVSILLKLPLSVDTSGLTDVLNSVKPVISLSSTDPKMVHAASITIVKSMIG